MPGCGSLRFRRSMGRACSTHCSAGDGQLAGMGYGRGPSTPAALYLGRHAAPQ
jgi:hypothetical protein